MMNPVEIDGRWIGDGFPPFVIAEMSGNHNGDFRRAMQLIEAAKAAGADAIKLQTYRPDTITIDHDSPEFLIEGGLWSGRRLYELYEEAHTPWEWHEPLFRKAREVGITIFSAPFDPTAVELLEGLGAPAYKIASPEIIDLPLIECVAKTKKPIIISTGMASLEEIHDAVDTARNSGAMDILVLHCTSAYPTPPEEANVRTVVDLRENLGVPTGLSDHSTNNAIATAAIALGACVVEKHLTLDRSDGGVDSAFSIEPEELRRLVIDLNVSWNCLGKPTYRATRGEEGSLKHRRSLYITKDIRAGEQFTSDNLRSIRPAVGLPPRVLKQVLGKVASRDIRFGEPLVQNMVVDFGDD